MNTCRHSATVNPDTCLLQADSEASLSALDITDCPYWTFSTSAWFHSLCKGLDDSKVSLQHPHFSGQETGAQGGSATCPKPPAGCAQLESDVPQAGLPLVILLELLYFSTKRNNSSLPPSELTLLLDLLWDSLLSFILKR